MGIKGPYKKLGWKLEGGFGTIRSERFWNSHPKEVVEGNKTTYFLDGFDQFVKKVL